MLDFKGELVLMGVTEERVPINTRDILEKGLSLYGSSRSTADDFEAFVELLKESEEYIDVLSRSLPESIKTVKNGNDFSNVLKDAEKPHWNKIIMEFDWEEKK